MIASRRSIAILVFAAGVMPTDLPLGTAMGKASARVAVVLLVIAGSAFAAGPRSVHSVRVTSEDSVTAVVVAADGALPLPRVGVLSDPPRIYLDFNGIATTTFGKGGGGTTLVRGVRVAINQVDPLITRIVIDLFRPTPHRVDVHLREQGQVTIVLGDGSAGAVTQGRPTVARPPSLPPAPLPALRTAPAAANPPAAAVATTAAPPSAAPVDAASQNAPGVGWVPTQTLAGNRVAAPAATARDSSKGDPSSAQAPQPVGGVPRAGGSTVGEWIVPRALRAAVGFNYQSANVAQTGGSLDDRLFGGGATLATSFALLDPRIVNVDFTGDFQANRSTSRTSISSLRDATGLRSYRVAVGVLAGRSAPLQVYADRVTSASSQEPLGTTSDPLRQTRGLRTGAGFTWDIEMGPLLPHIQLSGSTGRQVDERNYLFGYSSTNDERRAQLRMDRDYGRARYDIDFTHGEFVYDVPGADVRSDTGNDVLLATTRLMPSDRLTLDLHGRASRFRFGAGPQTSTVTGAGGDGMVRYQLTKRVATTARYSFSNNAFEAAMSGQVGPGQPSVAPVTTASQLATRTLFQDGEVRVEYTTRPLTAAVIGRAVSFDVPAFMQETLTMLSTGGASIRTEHSWRRLTFGAGIDASAGKARSNQARVQPYQEAGADLGVSTDIARTLRFGVDVGARRIGRLAFYPVTLEARNATVRFETMRPGWARLRATATRLEMLRDILYADARDARMAYSAGLGGARYDISVEFNQADTNSWLLSPSVLGSRPDVAILVASRPDLFANLLAANDRTRLVSLQVQPFGGLQLQARVRRQEQFYPGLVGFEVRGAQAWALWQLRELQMEVGWEYFDSATSFGTITDRRVYVRVRRDVIFF
jgi:hypothetical protein